MRRKGSWGGPGIAREKCDYKKNNQNLLHDFHVVLRFTGFSQDYIRKIFLHISQAGWRDASGAGQSPFRRGYSAGDLPFRIKPGVGQTTCFD
jgi:hypothetical protein